MTGFMHSKLRFDRIKQVAKQIANVRFDMQIIRR